jgi:hypothetical protein
MALSTTGFEQVRAKRARIDALLREGVRRQINTDLLDSAKIALDAAEQCLRLVEFAEKGKR